MWASQVALVVKNPPADVGDVKRCRFNPWVGKIPERRKWQSTPVFLPVKPHGQRSLTGYSLWVCKELDMTEQLRMCNDGPQKSKQNKKIRQLYKKRKERIIHFLTIHNVNISITA